MKKDRELTAGERAVAVRLEAKAVEFARAASDVRAATTHNQLCKAMRAMNRRWRALEPDYAVLNDGQLADADA